MVALLGKLIFQIEPITIAVWKSCCHMADNGGAVATAEQTQEEGKAQEETTKSGMFI